MNFDTFPVLTTQLLLLRQIQASDAEALFSYFSKDEVTKFFDLPTFQKIAEAHDLIKTWQERYLKKDTIRWAICLKDQPEKLIGTCGFHNFAAEHFRAEIGYELHPDFWQKGIMTEAILAIVPFGFKTFHLNRIEAFIDPQNLSSRKLLEKLNFASEGILHDYFYEKGRFVDGEIFALLKKDLSNFFVLTGGPGVGKTSLIEALARAGFRTVPEDARAIIKEQVEIGQDGLPWANKGNYAELMFNASLKSYKTQKDNPSSTAIFFDRGILDSICYMKMENIPIPNDVLEKTKNHPYNKQVFILPPWKEIYKTDTERKQNWQEVLFTYQKMKETYLEFGYTIIEVPKTDIKGRVAFISDHLHL